MLSPVLVFIRKAITKKLRQVKQKSPFLFFLSSSPKKVEKRKTIQKLSHPFLSLLENPNPEIGWTPFLCPFLFLLSLRKSQSRKKSFLSSLLLCQQATGKRGTSLALRLVYYLLRPCGLWLALERGGLVFWSRVDGVGDSRRPPAAIGGNRRPLKMRRHEGVASDRQRSHPSSFLRGNSHFLLIQSLTYSLLSTDSPPTTHKHHQRSPAIASAFRLRFDPQI